MKRNKAKPWYTPEGIKIRPRFLKNGGVSYQVDLGSKLTGANRKIRQFATVAEAERYAAQSALQRANQGLSAFKLNDQQRVDARAAIDLLEKVQCKATLKETTQFYLLHNQTAGGDINIDDVVSQYLEAKERRRLRPRSLGAKLDDCPRILGHGLKYARKSTRVNCIALISYCIGK